MGDFLTSFAKLVLGAVYWIMHWVGMVDHGFSMVMDAAGVTDPTHQIYWFLVVMAFLVVFALVWVRGYLGWFVMIFLLLLLLDRLVPSLSQQDYNHLVPGPLPGAL